MLILSTRVIATPLYYNRIRRGAPSHSYDSNYYPTIIYAKVCEDICTFVVQNETWNKHSSWRGYYPREWSRGRKISIHIERICYALSFFTSDSPTYYQIKPTQNFIQISISIHNLWRVRQHLNSGIEWLTWLVFMQLPDRVRLAEALLLK